MEPRNSRLKSSELEGLILAHGPEEISSLDELNLIPVKEKVK